MKIFCRIDKYNDGLRSRINKTPFYIVNCHFSRNPDRCQQSVGEFQIPVEGKKNPKKVKFHLCAQNTNLRNLVSEHKAKKLTYQNHLSKN